MPLLTLATQVRTRTLRMLQSAPPTALLFTPKGTSNHITWHTGHVLWVQDILIIQPLTGTSQLPPRWPNRFAQGSQPATDTQPWPTQSELLSLLSTQLQTLTTLLTTPSPLSPDCKTFHQKPIDLPSMIHALHDEAIHQGEISLLLKLFRAAS